MIAVVLMAGVGLTAAPAHAADTVYVYSVNMTQACQDRGHVGASYWNLTPYGWYCYNLTFSAPFVQPTGGVDIQYWCNKHFPQFPKIRAVVYKNNLFGWRCWYDTSWR
jgi:hypothetical protein